MRPQSLVVEFNFPSGRSGVLVIRKDIVLSPRSPVSALSAARAPRPAGRRSEGLEEGSLSSEKCYSLQSLALCLAEELAAPALWLGLPGRSVLRPVWTVYSAC
jgi:hypothetical protein